MNDRIDDRFSHGTWTREPVRSTRDSAQALVVEAAEGSDWWRDTAYGFRHANGHALLAPWVPDTAVEVTFDLVGFTGQFDQAGLYIGVDEAHWIKAGIEYSDGHQQLGAVVTNGASDWSTGAVDEWVGSAVTVRASRIADAVVIRARSSIDPEWRLVRVTPFPHESALIGPMLCAPMRPGFTVRFLRWRETEADTGIHAEPSGQTPH
jgi:regulation of enolase protein 1 (concanavalin A-like superfamily)